MRTRISLFVAMAAMTTAFIGVGSAHAASDCTFATSGSTMSLENSCTTDTTIGIPDGMTLDGNGHTITAVDPSPGHFTGAVVASQGEEAHVRRLTVTTSNLANACDGGADRLRGIMLEGASGSVINNRVLGINQGPSGCQEGNAIEIRNAPFDGTHPGTETVKVAGNLVLDYQKTGIVANGDVDAAVHNNRVGDSATQQNLAANSVQLGFGATGSVVRNLILGNQWKGTSNFAASAVLVYDADGVTVSGNNIRGNSDIGLYLLGDDAKAVNNRIFDQGPDHPNSGYDIGLGNWGAGNTVRNNKVRGFETPYDGTVEDNNKTIPSPM